MGVIKNKVIGKHGHTSEVYMRKTRFYLQWFGGWKGLTCETNLWSMYFLAMLAEKSADSMKRRKNSYTICRWGQAASRLGSSSSGSNSAPLGLLGGGRVLKRLEANMCTASANENMKCRWLRRSRKVTIIILKFNYIYFFQITCHKIATTCASYENSDFSNSRICLICKWNRSNR